jgi:aquaporin Z
VIVEFFGTFILVTVAAGSGVINHYVGTDPISRTAAVIAPGAVVMAMIYALGPLSGLHINPAVTLAFTGRKVFKAGWVLPYLVAQLGHSRDDHRLAARPAQQGRDRSGRRRRLPLER